MKKQRSIEINTKRLIKARMKSKYDHFYFIKIDVYFVSHKTKQLFHFEDYYMYNAKKKNCTQIIGETPQWKNRTLIENGINPIDHMDTGQLRVIIERLLISAIFLSFSSNKLAMT